MRNFCVFEFETMFSNQITYCHIVLEGVSPFLNCRNNRCSTGKQSSVANNFRFVKRDVMAICNALSLLGREQPWLLVNKA